MSRPRVLLIDDRVAVRSTLKRILAPLGCDIAEAANGKAALELLVTPFDVIFLDLKLPDISGIEVLRRARELGHPLGRVIVLTGYLEPDAEEETSRLGAFRHLTKDPISHTEVREAFAAALDDGTPRPASPVPRPAAEEPAPVAVPHTPPHPPRSRRKLPRPRVLVLDDKAYWRDTLERVLGDDFAVTTTATPEDAYRAAKRGRFDVVIIDIHLSGGVTGLEVLTRMAERTPDLKAIILTGEETDVYEKAIDSGRRGARMFVLKNQLATVPDRVRQILNEPVMSPSVFLSYDRRDRDAVKRLCTRLHKHGLRPWMDENDLLPGAKWDPSIEKQIREADHFIFCHSRHSRDKEGMLRKELNVAMSRLPEFREDRHFFLIARLDETEVVGALREFHYVDLFDGGFDKLLRAIAADAAPRR